MIGGSIETIPTITMQERNALHNLFAMFDQMPKVESIQADVVKRDDSFLSAGDDYNAKVTWESILEPLGWTKVYSKGDATAWRRPGKNEGVSATTNFNGNDKLFVFSTNTTVTVTWDSGSLSNETLTIYVGALSKTNSSIPDAVIGSANIADGSVTTAKIADTNVTAAKLASTLDLSGKTITFPTGIPAANIGAGTVDNTELGYLNGVTSAVQTQARTQPEPPVSEAISTRQ